MKKNKQLEPLKTKLINIPVPPTNTPNNKIWYSNIWWISVLLFFVTSIIWSKLGINTWDDDAITRFMQVQNASRNPYVFFESWVRPLFAIIFYLPIHFFGRLGLAVTMSLLTAASGCLLYKSVEKEYPETAVAIVAFLVFQTFLFGITRDAMTEPVASFIFSLGIYLYRKKKYEWFAVVGSLLPLARTETILLLPLWVLVLVLAKKYWQVLLLGTGLVAWFIGIYIYTGEFMGFFHELLKSGDKVNRYAHNAPGHHFFKYIYVLGPVVFYFMVLGSIISAKNIFKEYFILLQFVAGFLMYVFFSSYFDLGQSGGALRNLISLSPFATLLAFYGFNYWVNIVFYTENVKINNSGKKLVTSNKEETPGFKRLIIVAYSFILLLLAWQLFTNKLLLRQVYDDLEKDYTIFFYLLATVFGVLIMLNSKLKRIFPLIVVLLLVAQIIFTLSFESPDSHSNSERKIMGKMAEIISENALIKHKIFSNHPWLFWTTAKDMNDPVVSQRLDSISLNSVKDGDIIVWENHYTNANYTNITVETIQKNPSFIPITHINSEENNFIAILFIKTGGNSEVIKKLFLDLLKVYPDNANLNFYYGRFLLVDQKNYVAALAYLNKGLLIDASLNAGYYLRGVCYLQLNQKALACADFQKATSAGSPEAKAMLLQYCK